MLANFMRVANGIVIPTVHIIQVTHVSLLTGFSTKSYSNFDRFEFIIEPLITQ